MSLDALRRDYHQALCAQILYVDANDAPNFADKHSRPSVALAQGIVKKLPYPHCPTPLSVQLDTLIEGRRLRDISDLPFDLIT